MQATFSKFKHLSQSEHSCCSCMPPDNKANSEGSRLWHKLHTGRHLLLQSDIRQSVWSIYRICCCSIFGQHRRSCDCSNTYFQSDGFTSHDDLEGTSLVLTHDAALRLMNSVLCRCVQHCGCKCTLIVLCLHILACD